MCECSREHYAAAFGGSEVAAEEAEGLAGRALDNPVQQVYEAMWQPRYPEIEVVAPKA